ncbi:hypothetical protein L596_021482 [Steinernema carpocapsae]|uniref:Uncharacterized protein n=1 Tax=Steinernema carpocapsae TaxID=34508 RepID=A0A4U5MIW2_STECR|nr:hypothetical protein L596_021482 [Steinernema carpocapsae]
MNVFLLFFNVLLAENCRRALVEANGFNCAASNWRTKNGSSQAETDFVNYLKRPLDSFLTTGPWNLQNTKHDPEVFFAEKQSLEKDVILATLKSLQTRLTTLYNNVDQYQAFFPYIRPQFAEKIAATIEALQTESFSEFCNICQKTKPEELSVQEEYASKTKAASFERFLKQSISNMFFDKKVFTLLRKIIQSEALAMFTSSIVCAPINALSASNSERKYVNILHELEKANTHLEQYSSANLLLFCNGFPPIKAGLVPTDPDAALKFLITITSTILTKPPVLSLIMNIKVLLHSGNSSIWMSLVKALKSIQDWTKEHETSKLVAVNNVRFWNTSFAFQASLDKTCLICDKRGDDQRTEELLTSTAYAETSEFYRKVFADKLSVQKTNDFGRQRQLYQVKAILNLVNRFACTRHYEQKNFEDHGEMEQQAFIEFEGILANLITWDAYEKRRRFYLREASYCEVPKKTIKLTSVWFNSTTLQEMLTFLERASSSPMTEVSALSDELLQSFGFGINLAQPGDMDLVAEKLQELYNKIVEDYSDLDANLDKNLSAVSTSLKFFQKDSINVVCKFCVNAKVEELLQKLKGEGSTNYDLVPDNSLFYQFLIKTNYDESAFDKVRMLYQRKFTFYFIHRISCARLMSRSVEELQQEKHIHEDFTQMFVNLDLWVGYMKTHTFESRNVFNVCDSNIIRKKSYWHTSNDAIANNNWGKNVLDTLNLLASSPIMDLLDISKVTKLISFGINLANIGGKNSVTSEIVDKLENMQLSLKLSFAELKDILKKNCFKTENVEAVLKNRYANNNYYLNAGNRDQHVNSWPFHTFDYVSELVNIGSDIDSTIGRHCQITVATVVVDKPHQSGIQKFHNIKHFVEVANIFTRCHPFIFLIDPDRYINRKSAPKSVSNNTVDRSILVSLAHDYGDHAIESKDVGARQKDFERRVSSAKDFQFIYFRVDYEWNQMHRNMAFGFWEEGGGGYKQWRGDFNIWGMRCYVYKRDVPFEHNSVHTVCGVKYGRLPLTCTYPLNEPSKDPTCVQQQVL